MLGFDAIGKLALGQLPQQAAATQVFTIFSQWPAKKIAAAAIAATFTGFVAPPSPAQANVFSTFQTVKTRPICQVAWSFVPPPVAGPIAVFSTFSQPLRKPGVAQCTTTFEIFPPQPPPFTGFARFEAVIRAKPNVALFGNFKPFPIFIPVVDTHDGVFVKRKSKRKDWRDPIELELEEKAARRAAIELAIYGPPVEYKESPTVFAAPPPAPPDVAELAKVIAAVQAAHHQALRVQGEQDDETDLEAILREIL